MRRGSLNKDVSKFTLGHFESELLLEKQFRCWEVRHKDINLLVIVMGTVEAKEVSEPSSDNKFHADVEEEIT